ncbi:hypothetical protein Tco_0626736 [Tanacetum coccineum]|uniref:Reverse transcriptase domain-containing protein n=1 Tax=Tanacetum coccineum TaxID=301880 RepID=A0ABQ4WKG6_9ASTR
MPVLHQKPRRTKLNTPYPEDFYTSYPRYSNKIFWKILNVVPTPRNFQYACVIRSLTMELFTPFKNPKREFRSSRKLFKTHGLDESSSPEFDLFSDLKENSEEVAETMAETMEQYMSKTRADCGSGVTRPKIDDKDYFELKGQFLKELRDNTFSGSDHEDANEHIEKVLEIMQEVILFYNGLEVPTRQILDSKGAIPTKTAADTKVNEKVYAARVECELCKGPHYTKDYPLKEEGKTLEKLIILNLVYLSNKEGHIEQQLRDSIKGIMQILQRGSGSLPSSTETNLRDHVNSISTTVEADTTLIGRIDTIEHSLIFEPRQATVPFPSCLYNDRCDERKGLYGLKDLVAHSIGTTLRNDSLPKKEKDPRCFTLPYYINNVCFKKALANLGASVSVMSLSTYLNLGLGELAHTKLTVELADRTVKHLKGIAENILVGIGMFVFPVDFIILDIPEDFNVPLILGRPFLSTAHAKVDVFKRKIIF